jgi:soluble P-type ATPase
LGDGKGKNILYTIWLMGQLFVPVLQRLQEMTEEIKHLEAETKDRKCQIC